MAILLSCKNLSKTYGVRPLFEGLSFGLSEGERTGLIGPNGAATSPRLRLLAGLEEPDGGDRSMRRGLRVKYLAQQDTFDDAGGRTVREELNSCLHGLGLEDYEIDMRVEAGIEETGFDPE